MAEQYNDAVEKLKDPDLRKKFEDEMREREKDPCNKADELREAMRDAIG